MSKEWCVREYYDCEPDYLHELNTQKGGFDTIKEAYDFGLTYFDDYKSGVCTYSLFNCKTNYEISIDEYIKQLKTEAYESKEWNK